MLQALETFYSNHPGMINMIGVLIALLALVYPIYSTLRQQILTRKDNRFERYYKFMGNLVTGATPGTSPMMDQQIAIIYELRNFPDYYKVSKRVLTALKQHWAGPGEERLRNEIDLTIKYINTNWLLRRLNLTKID